MNWKKDERVRERIGWEENEDERGIEQRRMRVRENIGGREKEGTNEDR